MILRAFDVETTIINKGDPYHPNNRLVQVGFFDGTDYELFYKDKIDVKRIRELLYQSVLVGVNLKFDLAWMERLGIDTRQVRVLDLQLAEFLISNQTKAFPSLDYCAEKYLEQQKIDKIRLEYWDKGVDTWFIPEEELTEYLKEDLRLTYEVWLKQKRVLTNTGKLPLFRLQCADLVVLNNMEWNGIPYNKEESIEAGNALTQNIGQIRSNILSYTSCPSFNTGSGDHLSALLYGGTIVHKYRIPNGVYKTGQKVGQEKFKIVEEQYEQVRLIEPLKGSELKKEGYWSTDEFTLSSLKAPTKELRELTKNILSLSKLEKLRDTYYLGIPKLMDEKQWENNIIHGKFNQCVARTGRLSASEPNQQNFDPRLKELCRSAYVC